MVKPNSVDKGIQVGWTRATFILRKDFLSKLKAVSYWDRKKMKEVIAEALGDYLKGKKIKPLTFFLTLTLWQDCPRGDGKAFENQSISPRAGIQDFRSNIPYRLTPNGKPEETRTFISMLIITL
jgi:hypothetical protein